MVHNVPKPHDRPICRALALKSAVNTKPHSINQPSVHSNHRIKGTFNNLNFNSMSQFYKAQRTTKGLKIHTTHPIDKATAARRIKSGEDVYGSKRNASTLAIALSDGQGNMKDAPHLKGSYPHFHDVNHNYNGHIFYGEPSA